MSPFENKKIVLFSIASIGVLAFAINIATNIDSQPSVSEPSHSEARNLRSQQQAFNSERQLNATKKDKKSVSFLSARQNNHSSQTENASNDAASQRDKALAREKELARQQKCHESNIDEVGYITEAYNQKTLDSTAANLQILYQMQSCNRKQVGNIVNKIFADTDDVTHSMALLLDLLPQMQRTLSVINAIKQQNFSNDEMQTLITMTKDQPTGIKQALVPSIVKNDNLDNFLALTQQDNFFNSIEQRTGSYPTSDEASHMIQNLILSQRHNIQTDGAIYNHLLNTNPSSDTQNALTKIAFTTNQ